MSPIIQNLIIVVIVIFLGYIGYQMIVVGNNNVLNISGAGILPQEDLLSKTQDFIGRRAQLEAVTLDTDYLKDAKFTSLRSYSTPVPDQTVGRDNIFDKAQSISSAAVAPHTP